MRRLAPTLLVTALYSTVLPAVQAFVAPDAAWKKLLALAISEGTFAPATETTSAWYKLTYTETDPADDITILGVTVLAVRLPGGGVKTGAVLMSMSQATHLPNNQAASDQWFFELSPTGQLQKVTRQRASSKSGNKMSSTLVPLSDPEVRHILEAMLDYWSK